MKLATIIGARPQFVKAAALSRAIADANAQGSQIREILVHTGQHYDSNMSDVFFKEMNIPDPHYHLGIGGLTHGAMTGRMLEAIETLLANEKPDWVVVFGDTNSTLAGALAAVKMHIPVAHVEAGLRSFNRRMPEEINRILADQCSDLLFTPADTASSHLINEGIPESKIRQVGDVMFDAALHYQSRAKTESHAMDKYKLAPKEYVLATIHRAENTDDPARLKEIFLGLMDIAAETRVVLPLHPRTRQMLDRHGLYKQANDKLTLIDPVGYLDMVSLESQARLIMTDSGGVQKEAYFFKVPCLTLRTETEWVELVRHGFNRLVPLARGAIYEMYRSASSSKADWSVALYGDGKAASHIIEHLLTQKK